MQRRGTDLADVVRRNAGGHANGDTGGAIGQQVGKGRRQHHRLLVFAVVGAPEVDGVLVEAVEQRLGHRRQPRLGVAHRCRGIAVDVAEVALALDQRIAHGEVLGEANQRLVDGRIAVRVVAADDVADDPGALLEPGCRVQTQLAHRVEQAAMHRLQPVARIGERAANDGRDGVGQIALGDRIAEADVLDDAVGTLGHARLKPSIWRQP